MDIPDQDETQGEVQGDVPEGVGPEVFREHLRQAAGDVDAADAHIQLDEQAVVLGDIETVEAEDDTGHRSRVRLRNGVIIGGVTGAAIVAALATIRYRRRHSK